MCLPVFRAHTQVRPYGSVGDIGHVYVYGNLIPVSYHSIPRFAGLKPLNHHRVLRRGLPGNTAYSTGRMRKYKNALYNNCKAPMGGGFVMRKILTIITVIAVVIIGGCAMQAESGEPRTPMKIKGFEKLPSFHFLWPGGDGNIEMSGEQGDGEQVDTPFGKKDSVVIRWSVPGGGNVADTRIIRFSGEDGTDSFVFETKIKKEIKAPTGDYFKAIAALPAIRPPSSLNRVLTYKVEPFSPPTHEPEATTGPVVLYNDSFDVTVISPLDNFMAAMQTPVDGEWHCGFGGLIEKIPAGTVHRVLVVSGKGIRDTFLKWGDFVRGWHNHKRPAFDADVGLKYLGYWTDNGAYYYYKDAPDMNYHQTLMAVKKSADRRGIPYGYFQIDSWWYPKAKSNSILGAFRGGALLWEPIPEMFPKGLAAFRKELGLPLIAHNRWYDRKSPYCEKYKCVYGKGHKTASLPIDAKFWDEIMDNAVSYGVEVYEQDWLATQMSMIPWLRSGFGNASSWFDAMISSAKRHGLTMQLCMAGPEFFLQQMKHDIVTQVRCSGDYIARIPKTFYWPKFHKTSMFAYAVGLWPFKDNFQSSTGQRFIRSERWPFEEALISVLSAGLVGPGDKIGAEDADLLMRTCRKDGVLLKPDMPALPIDLMYIENKKPWIVTTETRHNIGTTTYLAAFNLRPRKMKDPAVSFQELGISGDYAVYNWRKKEVMNSKRIEFGRMPKNDAFYYMICPRLGNGMVVIGEADKMVPLSSVRFTQITFAEGRLTIKLKGVPGEAVNVSVYSDGDPKSVEGGAIESAPDKGPGIFVIKVKIDDAGEAELILGS